MKAAWRLAASLQPVADTITAMRHFASIAIAAPATRVWEVLSGVQSWPAWLPTVDHVEALDGWPLAIGRRYRVAQPRLRPALWKVTVLEPGNRFVWTAASPGMRMIASHAVEPAGADSTRVQLRYDFRGWLGAPMGVVFGRLTRSISTRRRGP